MMAILLSLMTLPASFLLHMALERWRFRASPPRSRQNAVAKVSAVVVVALTLTAAFLTGSWLATLYVLTASAGIGHLYFHVFNFTETARRIRILVARYTGSPLEGYNPEVMIEERVRRLTAMGSLRREGNGFRARPGVMLLAAKAFSWWGWLFGISSSSR